jgi:hypothetical protein
MFKAVLFFGLMIASQFAVAHTEPRSCQQVQELARELGCGMYGSSPTATPANDFIVNSSYGPTQCKVADALKVGLKELRDDCQAWLKQQKSEMGSKYQSGVCNDECNECGMSLKTCTVKGTVHYSK